MAAEDGPGHTGVRLCYAYFYASYQDSDGADVDTTLHGDDRDCDIHRVEFREIRPCQ